MNQIDEIAHLIQLSVAPVFLLTGVGTLLNVLSGCLARIIDRARVLEQRWDTPEPPHAHEIASELHVLEKRARLIYHAIKLSTSSALLVCFVIAALFASSMLHYPTRRIVSGLFVAATLTLIVSLTLFLREVYFAIGTFEIALPAATREIALCMQHTARDRRPSWQAELNAIAAQEDLNDGYYFCPANRDWQVRGCAVEMQGFGPDPYCYCAAL